MKGLAMTLQKLPSSVSDVIHASLDKLIFSEFYLRKSEVSRDEIKKAFAGCFLFNVHEYGGSPITPKVLVIAPKTILHEPEEICQVRVSGPEIRIERCGRDDRAGHSRVIDSKTFSQMEMSQAIDSLKEYLHLALNTAVTNTLTAQVV